MASLENETQNWVRSYELRLVELAVMTPIVPPPSCGASLWKLFLCLKILGQAVGANFVHLGLNLEVRHYPQGRKSRD